MNKCKKCGLEFKNFVLIDGKIRNLNKRSFCLKCSPFGIRNTKDLTKEPTEKDGKKICPKCNRFLNLDNFYKKKSNFRSYCKVCFMKQVKDRQILNKKKAVDYKGGKCVKCGYNKCIIALEFHHLNPSKKDKDIKSMKGMSLENIKKELDKCILICSNCHRELHYNLHRL